MSKKTAKGAAEPISDEDLAGVVGAGDPVPYPDTGGGGSTKDVSGGDVGGSEAVPATGEESGGLSSPKTTGGAYPTSPSGDVKHQGGSNRIPGTTIGGKHPF